MNCVEIKREIAEMSIDELRDAHAHEHVSSCPNCQAFLGDMAALSSGLETLVIPHPMGMRPPASFKLRRDRILNLIAATLALLVFGALAAVVYQSYFVQEPAHGKGSRESIFYKQPSVKTAEPPLIVK